MTQPTLFPQESRDGSFFVCTHGSRADEWRENAALMESKLVAMDGSRPRGRPDVFAADGAVYTSSDSLRRRHRRLRRFSLIKAHELGWIVMHDLMDGAYHHFKRRYAGRAGCAV